MWEVGLGTLLGSDESLGSESKLSADMLKVLLAFEGRVEEMGRRPGEMGVAIRGVR